MAHARVDERLHFLDVGEGVRARDELAEFGVLAVRLHVEDGLGLAEGAGHVVVGLVGLAVVDGGEFCRVGDEEEGGCYAEDGAWWWLAES